MPDTPDVAGASRRSSRLPTLPDMAGLFPDGPLGRDLVAASEAVPPEHVPEPYRRLLVHEHHMTVTLETFHGAAVALAAQEISHQGDSYARQLVLTAGPQGPVVMAGVMRIRLASTPERVRREILAANTPLGRILIENDVLRRIELVRLLRFRLDGRLAALFAGASEPARASNGGAATGGAATGGVTYGRLAMIHVDEKPAVELLEIVSPHPAADATTPLAGPQS